jgi:hypothetical protein
MTPLMSLGPKDEELAGAEILSLISKKGQLEYRRDRTKF